MQKFINAIVAMLVVFSVYFGIFVDRERSKTMVQLATSDVELQGHKRVIDEEYRRLTLKFEGRGKHMKRLQEDIETLRRRLRVQVDSLGNKIEETNFYLEQVEEMLRSDIRDLDSELRALSDEVGTYKRRTNRTLLDVQETISRIDDDLKALGEKIEPKEPEPE